MKLTPDEEAQVRELRGWYPYRLIYVARKPGEETVISAVTSRRIPNRLAREGWEVCMVS